MKKQLGIVFLLILVLIIQVQAGLMYLKNNDKDAYNSIMALRDNTVLFAENSFKNITGSFSGNKKEEPVIEVEKITSEATDKKETEVVKADSKQEAEIIDAGSKEKSNTATSASKQLDTNVPITKNVKNSISQQELSAAQKANMVPVKGTGKETEKVNSTYDAGAVATESSFPELMYPYRAMLNKEEQKAYDQIYANAVKYNRSPFAIQASISSYQMDNIMTAVYNDHPELFWLETQYEYQYGRDGKVYSTTLKFNRTIDDIKGNVDRFNQKVNEIISQAKQYKTGVEKEKFVHDYLTKLATYNESAPMNQSAYSALINGKSVCAGYSRAFQHIMMQLGIPTYYCTGIAKGGPHAWNIIKLGDKFYNVDSLWDDSIGEQYRTQCYLYFNIPDSEFNTEHKRTELSVKLPACTSTDMSYENVFGSSAVGDILSTYGLSEKNVLNSLEAYYKYCEEQLTKAGTGQSSFTVALIDKKLFDKIYLDASQKGNLKGYMNTVAKNLGLSNYSLSLKYSIKELPDGHIILIQNNNLISK
jgi:hypothetical protein